MPARDFCGVGSLAWARRFLSVVWGLKEVLILRVIFRSLLCTMVTVQFVMSVATEEGCHMAAETFGKLSGIVDYFFPHHSK